MNGERKGKVVVINIHSSLSAQWCPPQDHLFVWTRVFTVLRAAGPYCALEGFSQFSLRLRRSAPRGSDPTSVQGDVYCVVSCFSTFRIFDIFFVLSLFFFCSTFLSFCLLSFQLFVFSLLCRLKCCLQKM